MYMYLYSLCVLISWFCLYLIKEWSQSLYILIGQVSRKYHSFIYTYIKIESLGKWIVNHWLLWHKPLLIFNIVYSKYHVGSTVNRASFFTFCFKGALCWTALHDITSTHIFICDL